MRDTYAAMIDAMLLEGTTPEQAMEIGRMAVEGVSPPTPDEDPVQPVDGAASWAKDFLLSRVLESMPAGEEEEVEQPGPITEAEPQPTPQPGPLRHAKKETAAPVLAPPITVDEIKAAATPAPIVIHNHLPPLQESPAMVALAKSLGKSFEKMADNASKPAEPAKITIAKGAVQVTTPPVTIAKGAVNVDIKPPPPAKITNHITMPKVKDIQRDKDGKMVRPIYEGD